MQGSAEFFAPETRMVPTSGLPPRMTNLSMDDDELHGQCKCEWQVDGVEKAYWRGPGLAGSESSLLAVYSEN